MTRKNVSYSGLQACFCLIVAIFLMSSLPARAGEDPKKTYQKSNGTIDTAIDTNSDGYMRDGTKLVVDCEAGGGTCPETPNLPPTKAPVARDDAYFISYGTSSGEDQGGTPICAMKRSGATVSLGGGSTFTCGTGVITLPVLSNDDEGTDGPVTVSLVGAPVYGYVSTIWHSPGNVSYDILSPGRAPAMPLHLDSSGRMFVISFFNVGGFALDASGGVKFKYRITDQLGRSSEATAVLRVEVQTSPLVLDLDGDDIEMLPLSQGVLFDINMDGVKDQISWIAADDGFLVLDRNGDGMITHRKELFGNLQDEKLNDGFASLLRYDDNKDYIMDAQDKIFPSLLVWRDLNKDGVGTPNELKPLSAYGVVSIDLNAVMVHIDYMGETTITHQSTYTLKDGSKRQIADVWFSNILGQKPTKIDGTN